MVWAPLMVLASCSSGQKSDWPSLAADNLWDKMAEERKRPFPGDEETSEAGDSSDEVIEDMIKPDADLVPPADRNLSRKILQEAAGKYESLTQALDQGFAEFDKNNQTQAEKEQQWRTLQLYVSRLKSLEKNLHQAILDMRPMTNLQTEDQALVVSGQGLQQQIASLLTLTKSRLAEIERSNNP